MLKKARAILGFLLLASITYAYPQSTNPQIESILGKLSLEEKAGQLTLYTSPMDNTGNVGADQQIYLQKIREGKVGAIFNAFTPRFTRELQDIAVLQSPNKIPLLFGYDVIHGHRTIFPVPLAEAASWNLPAIEKTARISAIEATADGIHWVFAPMVDVARDARWGRVVEGSGEDPWLGSKISAARVKGFQGTSLRNTDSTLATVKHFAAYGAAEGGRDYNTVNMSLQELFENFLPPYKAAVDAGVGSVMTAFNEINGMPSSGNPLLLKDLLQKSWGFKGLIVSDYTSVRELIQHGSVIENEKLDEDFHSEDAHFPRDQLAERRLRRRAALQAFKGGVHMDMQGGDYLEFLPGLVRNNYISQNELDEAVRVVLNSKFQLGLLKDPYKNCDESRAARDIMSPEHLAHARDIARRSIVLLKNDAELLPLKVSQEVVPQYSNKRSRKSLKYALIGPMIANKRDQIGSWSAAGNFDQVKTLLDAFKARSSRVEYALGANLIDDGDLRDFLNQHGGHIIPDSRSPQKLRQEAVDVARRSDVIVLALGEAFGMTGEAASTTQITLPKNQRELLRELAKTKKPIVLLLFNGRPLELSEETQLATSILETWYLGHEAGNAIVDVLFGDHNPSGKLPMSFPYRLGQIPIYYNHKNTGRPISTDSKYTSKYIDMPRTPIFPATNSNEALYPFGWGLSYTTFRYSDLQLDRDVVSADQKLLATVTLTNTGKWDGTETLQLYLRDVAGSSTRPLLQLKNFKQIFLKAGESKEVTFEITPDDLKYYQIDFGMGFREALRPSAWKAEAGSFKVFVGGNSRHLLEADFKLR